MNKDFEIIDHTADVGIRAYGADLKEAFTNAARGLFSLITELDSVDEILQRNIEVDAPDEEILLVAWLNELIYLFDVENVLFKRFEINKLSDTHLEATAFGEKVDKTKHELKIGVKAATYHMTKIVKDDGYRVEVLLDI